MRLWKRRWFRISVLITVALAAVQCGMYWALGEGTMSATVLRQYGMVTSGQKMDFVAVEAESWAAMSPEQRARLEGRLHLCAATVYHDVADVRLDQMVTEPLTAEQRASIEKVLQRTDIDRKTLAGYLRTLDQSYVVRGYKNGMSVSWRRVRSGLFWMRCGSGYWVTGMNASGGEDLYVWVLYRWVRIRDYGHFIS